MFNVGDKVKLLCSAYSSSGTLRSGEIVKITKVTTKEQFAQHGTNCDHDVYTVKPSWARGYMEEWYVNKSMIELVTK